MKDEATWDEVEKEVVLVECLLKRLVVEDKKEAACRIAVAVVNQSAETYYEALGILEEAKNQYRQFWESTMRDEEEDE